MEALQKRPWGFVEQGRTDGLWRMLGCTLRSKTGGGRGGWADVARRLPATAHVLALWPAGVDLGRLFEELVETPVRSSLILMRAFNTVLSRYSCCRL